MTDEKKLVVERVIDQPADVIFQVLTNPERHREIDGSGTVVSDEKTNRIQAVGDVFRMNMNAEAMGGDYKTDNTVTGYQDNKLVAWKTAPAGTEPPGWQWVWELEAQGPDSTLVRHTYDWSGVSDKALLQRVSFPAIPESALQTSLANLATVSGS